jgi:hypothetical protein
MGAAKAAGATISGVKSGAKYLAETKVAAVVKSPIVEVVGFSARLLESNPLNNSAIYSLGSLGLAQTFVNAALSSTSNLTPQASESDIKEDLKVVEANPDSFRYSDFSSKPISISWNLADMLQNTSTHFAKYVESPTLGLSTTADVSASTQYVICPVGVGVGNVFESSLSDLYNSSFKQQDPTTELYDLSTDKTVDDQMEVMKEIFSDLAKILGEDDNLKELIKYVAILRAAVGKTSRECKVRVLQQLTKSEAVLRKARRAASGEARKTLIKDGVVSIQKFLTSFQAPELNAAGLSNNKIVLGDGEQLAYGPTASTQQSTTTASTQASSINEVK